MRFCRSLLLLATLTTVSMLEACTTIDTWDKGLPKTSPELTTDTARQAEYHRYVVHDVGVAHGKGYFVIAGEKDGEERRYSAASFYPVIERVSPGVKAAIGEIETLHEKRQWTDAATGVGIAAAIFGPGILLRHVGEAALVGGLGGGFVLQGMEKAQLENVMRRYNDDLMQRIYARTEDDPVAAIPAT